MRTGSHHISLVPGCITNIQLMTVRSSAWVAHCRLTLSHKIHVTSLHVCVNSRYYLLMCESDWCTQTSVQPFRLTFTVSTLLVREYVSFVCCWKELIV